VFAFNAVQLVGYAVGPAIWAGLTMVVSFTWGVTAFGHEVNSWRGSCPAMGLLVLGVCLAAASGSDTARKLGRRQLSQAQEGSYGTCVEEGLGVVRADAEGSSAQGALRTALGCGCAVAVGLMNGTLMVPVTLFQSGSATLGILGYKGDLLSPIAFLPSLSIGILCMQVPTFLIYFARDISYGRPPQFQVSIAAAPGLVTGAYWAMGNFASMFAMTYLGQTIGFPLTQTCIVIGGLWGIFYYGEIEGRLPITMFTVSVALIIAGAALDGRYG
jgi:glucose uptake protein GlcU